MRKFLDALSTDTQKKTHIILYLYFPPLKRVPRTNDIIVRQDGGQPHFSRVVATFSGGWVGRGGSILCSPRSPDLTPLDFFFWDYVKNYVYVTKIPRPKSPETRIRDTSEQVTRDTLQRVWSDVGY
jgi:hypothetical protein